MKPQLAYLASESDVIVSTYDPSTVHQIAALMKIANPQLFWVADYRDLWSLNHVADWTKTQRKKEARAELGTVGALADLITSVSEEFARDQGSLTGKPWLTVTNGFDVDMAAIHDVLKRPLTESGAPLKVVYTGKIYPYLRDPSPLLEELVAMEETGLIPRGAVRVDIYGGQIEGIQPLVGSRRFDHFLRLHGHVSRDIALAAQRNADLLLLLESPSPVAKGVLTGKIFEYIASGVPILSLGSKSDSAIGTFLTSTQTGFCAENNRANIRSIILSRLNGHRLEWFDPDLGVIAGYSRKQQALKLLAAILEMYAAKKEKGR
ncbi:MAG: hypothetical protein ACOYBW_00665 [Fluviibacter phosphoraccumulans]